MIKLLAHSAQFHTGSTSGFEHFVTQPGFILPATLLVAFIIFASFKRGRINKTQVLRLTALTSLVVLLLIRQEIKAFSLAMLCVFCVSTVMVIEGFATKQLRPAKGAKK